MKKYFILLLILIPSLVQSQNVSARMGNKQFAKLNYSKAIEYYEYSIKKDSLNIEIIRNLATAYENTQEYSHAKKTYQYLIRMNDQNPKDWLNYGHFLNQTGNYTEAVSCYKHYSLSNTNDEQIKKLIRKTKLKSQQKLSTFPVHIKNLDLNTSFTEFGPTYYKNKLIFSSGRQNTQLLKGKYGWDNQYYLNLFSYNLDNKAEKVKSFANRIGSKYHEGGISFSSNYKTMYFTRNNYFKGKLGKSKDGFNNLKIFKAEEHNGKWKITSEFPYNSDEYSIGHPCLSKDGKSLYFVSDMPNGLGKTDIYRCQMTPNGWSKPENLGHSINTDGREMFPFLADNGYLFFASDGHAGLGGLDMYAVDLSQENLKPVHLGSPISSEADDFSLIMNQKGTEGFFASNRLDGKGSDDLYAFYMDKKNKIRIEVRDSKTREALKADSIYLSKSEEAQLVFDNKTLHYQLNLSKNQDYSISVEKKGYQSKDTSFHYGVLDPLQTHVIHLDPIQVFTPISASVYFDFDRYGLRTEARDSISKLIVYMQEHTNIILSIEANTDIRGTNLYNQKLAKKRANEVIKMFLNHAITADRIQIKILGEEKPLLKTASETQRDWHQSNRRVDLMLKEQGNL